MGFHLSQDKSQLLGLAGQDLALPPVPAGSPLTATLGTLYTSPPSSNTRDHCSSVPVTCLPGPTICGHVAWSSMVARATGMWGKFSEDVDMSPETTIIMKEPLLKEKSS